VANSKVVIGYGNDLRRDDGAGRRVADEMAKRQLAGVVVHSLQQLTPELVEALGAAAVAVFVDARVPDEDDDRAVRVERIPVDAPVPANPVGHFGDPRHLLRWTQALYGRAPEAWWVTIPARDFGFGESLTDTASAGVEAAIREVAQLLAD
jgi:hydrogenase maturation protease